MNTEFPQLSNDFFSVCQTAIKAAAWKYEDFGRVKQVEGELEALRVFLHPRMNSLAPEIPTVVGQGEELEPQVALYPSEEVSPHHEAPVAQNENEAKLFSPEEAKQVPVRPMPDDILLIVQDGLELAKNPPKVANVSVKELPADPDQARKEFSRPF